jgi:hypothetical protein
MMRTEPAPENILADDTIQQADYRAKPYEVLDAVDSQLLPYGLEVVLFDTGDDSYAWRLAKSPTLAGAVPPASNSLTDKAEK